MELVVTDVPALVGPATKTLPVCLECLSPPMLEANRGYCRGCGFLLCQDCAKEDRRFHVKNECDILAESGLSKEVHNFVHKVSFFKGFI